jgi:hypothetical protein
MVSANICSDDNESNLTRANNRNFYSFEGKHKFKISETMFGRKYLLMTHSDDRVLLEILTVVQLGTNT